MLEQERQLYLIKDSVLCLMIRTYHHRSLYQSIVHKPHLICICIRMFYAPYNWPHFNNYKAAPSEDNLPTEIFSAQWLKREIARSVLQDDLPLSAIFEAEKAVEIIQASEVSSEFRPTDPATHSRDPTDQGSNGGTSHQSIVADLPQMTGHAHGRAHLHDHGRRRPHY